MEIKQATDVIAEWVKRGYITQEQATEHEEKYQSYIEQAKTDILTYCNIPPKASIPDGLFFAWVEIAYSTSKEATMIQDSSVIKSISEGDTTITYDIGTTAAKNDSVVVGYVVTLNRYRRFP